MIVGKRLLTLGALVLTAALVLLFPRLTSPEKASIPGLRVTRVWTVDCDPAVGAWLKRQAAAFERAQGARVYLRTATGEEAALALEKGSGVVAPDVLVQPGKGLALARLGYALILRDESAPPISPAPTSALFYKPSPPPGPASTPRPTPDPGAVGTVLCPPGLDPSLPHLCLTQDPLAAFVKGEAPAALLTAGQAAQLPWGYQAHPLPEGGGSVVYGGLALTGAGAGFLDHLKTNTAQQALAAHGLYSVLPTLRLYDPAADPLRALIERSLPALE